MPDPSKPRCEWVGRRADDDIMVRYHDEEWGVPEHNDRRLFELLTLEGAQAGLSWQTVLNRREGYRHAFADFDFERVAAFTDADQARLLLDPGIIRNRAKIAATIGNARGVISLREELGSFDAYLWRFVDGAPLQSSFESLSELPAKTAASAALSKDLQRRGFRFVGPTICYAFMQAAGLVNDHISACFRYRELGGR
ncbi:MAG: DNA-3-methyladenine glycosylase I [Dehalococcoidia bacterium]|nr:DNA-3-methyladenine glycosylase I [Dehalococcoidia bacterium]